MGAMPVPELTLASWEEESGCLHCGEHGRDGARGAAVGRMALGSSVWRRIRWLPWMLDNVGAVTQRNRYQLVLQDLAQRSNPDALAHGYGPSCVTGLLEMQRFRRPLRRSFAVQPRAPPPGISASAPVGALTPALLDQATGIPAIRPRCSGYFSTLESALLQRQEGQIVQSCMNLRDSRRDSGLRYSAYATGAASSGRRPYRDAAAWTATTEHFKKGVQPWRSCDQSFAR